jgi:hypothetical protein
MSETNENPAVLRASGLILDANLSETDLPTLLEESLRHSEAVSLLLRGAALMPCNTEARAEWIGQAGALIHDLLYREGPNER